MEKKIANVVVFYYDVYARKHVPVSVPLEAALAYALESRRVYSREFIDEVVLGKQIGDREATPQGGVIISKDIS